MAVFEELLAENTDRLSRCVDAVAAKTTLIDVKQNGLYASSELASEFDTLFEPLKLETLPLDRVSFFNGISSNYLALLHQQSPTPETLLLKTLVLLDVSIYAAHTKYDNLKAFPMQTLNSIMLTCSIGFVTETFGPVFLAACNLDRRLKLTLDNTLVGKTKPGSTLLQIGNTLLPKLINQLGPHDVFATKLLTFISDSFDINDKLLLTSDWRINEFDRIYLEFSKSRKWPSAGGRQQSNRRGALGDIYAEYMNLALYFTADFTRLVDELNSTRGGGRYGKASPFLESCRKVVRAIKELDVAESKGLSSQKPKPKTEPVRSEQEVDMVVAEYSKKEHECDWLLNSDEFAIQVSDAKNRRIIALQLYIMLSFIYDLTDSKWTKLITEVNRKFRKFRKPDFAAVLENDSAKSALGDLLTDIERHYSTHNVGFHRVMKHLVDNTEYYWRFLKLKQFNHEKIADLAALSEPKKRKLEDDLEASKVFKKPYFHALGTPKLSQIWKVETGLEGIKSQLSNQQDRLESCKDDLYFLEGGIKEREEGVQEGEDTSLEDLREQRDLLNWKRLRFSRTLGSWVDLS